MCLTEYTHGVGRRCGRSLTRASTGRTQPNNAVEPTASSFGFAPLRLRFRRRPTAGVRRQWKEDGSISRREETSMWYSAVGLISVHLP